MSKIKNIPQPKLKSATALTPMEMNAIHFDKKHTVLTPAVLNAQQAPATPSEPKTTP